MHVPDVTEQQDDIYVQDFWTQGRPLLAVDYLPFFSSCRGFDSHIYFYYLTETSWTEIQDFVNYGECTLVPVNETIFIDQWAPQIAMAVADACAIEISCFYEVGRLLSFWKEALGRTQISSCSSAYSARLYEQSAVSLQVRHALISVKCLFWMTLLRGELQGRGGQYAVVRGGGRHALPHHAGGRGPRRSVPGLRAGQRPVLARSRALQLEPMKPALKAPGSWN